MMEALKKAIAEEGQSIPTDRAPRGTKGVTEALWREYWRMMTNKKGGAERTAWSRAYEKLEEAPHVRFLGRLCLDNQRAGTYTGPGSKVSGIGNV
jgi:hypothetical protein